MQLIQTFTANHLLFKKSTSADTKGVLRKIEEFFLATIRDRGRAGNAIVSRYKGRGWDDSAERELNNDIAIYRCSRF